MIGSTSARRLVAWFASLAVLLASLAPSIAQAVRRDGSGAWIEVCSVLGNKLVAPDGTQRDSAPAKHLLQHCPYCALHATALGMPPAPPSLPAVVRGGGSVPALLLAAPRPLFAWAAAQPRGPPAVSS